MASRPEPSVQDEEEGRQGAEKDCFRSTLEALRAAPRERRIFQVDPEFFLEHSDRPQAQVHGDYDCTLNQTNIRSNNNKFYIIQLLADGQRFTCWNRWGRVGEVSRRGTTNFYSLDEAKKDFEKKFREKTKKRWAERDYVVAHPGKYTLIEVQGEDDAQEAVADGGPVRTCSLDAATQELITNIFGTDMFSDTMALMNLDAENMPLGKLSKQQIARGFEALEALEAALTAPAAEDPSLDELSSRFYTVIPHNFGRRTVPPTIRSLELLQAKKDMLLVLADIELARSRQTAPEEEVPHPLDRDYHLLKCQLQFLDPEAPEYEVIHTYLKQTSNNDNCPALQHVWKMTWEGEGDRFQAHRNLENLSLLWRCTNGAVVAAILTSGLPITPHSGGRVVTGMACGHNRIGYMFLGEVALGREHHVTTDEPSLKRPPPGFDSVVARGHTEPDPTQDTELELDGQRVAVPQGRPMPCSEFRGPLFSQSEYLFYRQSQCHLRYLLEVHL